MSEFELRQKRGHGSDTILKADSLDEIAAFLEEKSGDHDPFGVELEGFDEY